MDEKKVLMSNSLKKRFVRDCNIPISVYEEPYFTERLKTLNCLFDTNRKWKQFVGELKAYASAEEYLAYYNDVKDAVITDIKTHDAFRKFNSESFASLDIFPDTALYSSDNEDEIFISLDIKKANFSVLQYYNPAIFNFSNTWEEYLSRFTASRHILESKYIRQVIFGACNPGQQVRYEDYIMKKIATELKKIYNIHFLSVKNDEIIIKGLRYYHKGMPTLNEFAETLKNLPDNLASLLKITVFKLEKVGDIGWVKLGSESCEPDFKGIDAEIFHQVFKYWHDININENDLVFYHNHKLAKFLSPIKNPFEGCKKDAWIRDNIHLSAVNNHLNGLLAKTGEYCNKSSKAVKFVKYTGKYPNLCAGALILNIDGENVYFGSRFAFENAVRDKQIDKIPSAFYSAFWESGAKCRDDYRSEWQIDYNCIPDEYKPYAAEINKAFNDNVQWGCCGGCI